MLAASAQRILESLDPDDLVLDVGGWGRPLTRADWVIDLMPYETRGLYGRDGPDPERFDSGTWVQRDMCDREPWPFEKHQFDFVVCSHTLEDVRDPIWVCSEIVRVGKAGYVEVPSRLEEQTYGIQGPWVGWGHHHWLVDVDDGRIDFVFKPHVLHNRDGDHFPPGFADFLGDAERVETLWWEDAFDYRERFLMSPEDLDNHLAEYVKRHLGRAPSGREARLGLDRVRDLLRRR